MKVVRFIVLFLFLASAAYAQIITGTIQGTVSDQTGAILPGVSITVRNLGTNLTRNTLTNETGNYVIPLLPVGKYEVSAEYTGFKTQVKSGLELQVEQKLNVNFQLEVGQMTERLVVTEAAPLVQADTATVGNVVDSQKIVELPLNGRLFNQLALLVPATTTLPPGDSMGIPQRGGFSVAGNRQSANNFLIDGIDNNDISINIASVKPSVDQIQEFKIQSGTYSSEFGRGGGAQINVITKGGGNDIHGSAYGFLRDDSLDARNFFDRPQDPKPYFSRKQFGGTIGGPIAKDRTFYFGSYEGLRLKQGITRTAIVPLSEMRRGDFSSLLRTPNLLGSTAITVRDPLTGNPFPNNVIPSDRIDASGRAIVAIFPDPNFSGTGRNLVSSPFDTNNWNLWSVRVDHKLSDKNSFFGRINSDNLKDLIAFDPFNPTNLPGYGRINPVTAENIGIVDTHVFGPTLINELRIGYGYLRENKAQQNQGKDATEQILGIKGTSRDPKHFGYPRIDITGFGTIGEPTNEPQDRRVHTYHYYDSVVAIHGNHTWKFGVDIRRMLNNFNFNSTVRGQFQFTGRYTGVGLADALLGYPQVVSLNRGDTQRYFRATSFNWFVQHDWKYSRRLTFNLGLRYEVNTPPIEKDNILSNFNPKTAQIELAGKDIPRGIFKPDLNNFGPRVGIAYNLTADGRTIMRAGYGVYYNQQVWSAVLTGSAQSSPFVSANTWNADVARPNITLRDPFPAGAIGRPSLFSQDPNFRSAYMQQYSFGIQRELPHDMVFEVSYLGNKATKLDIARPINQPRPGTGQNGRPFPAYSNLNQTRSAADSNYNSMILRVEKRFSHGLTFLASETWGKAIGDQGSPDMLNESLGRGPLDIDNRHRVTANFVYELPFLRGDSLASKIFGGWQTSGVLTFRSGQAITPRITQDRSQTFLNADRPDLIGDWKKAKPDPSGWWNKDAFRLPAPLTFGTAGTGALIGPEFKSLDFSLGKNFKITESKRFEFRSEFFNFTNHPNFYRPETAFDNANFGVVTQALESRQIQFGLKFIY